MSNGHDKPSPDPSRVPTMPYRRATPSSPMAALSPEDDPTDIRLDDEQRDALVKKTISRVERIDREVGILVDAHKRTSQALRALQNDQGVISSDLKQLTKKSEAMMAILSNIIDKLESVSESVDAIADRMS